MVICIIMVALKCADNIQKVLMRKLNDLCFILISIKLSALYSLCLQEHSNNHIVNTLCKHKNNIKCELTLKTCRVL